MIHFARPSVLALAFLLFGHASAQQKFSESPDESRLSARPQLAASLQAAQELLGQKKYAEVLALLAHSDEMKDKTPAERYLVERFRASAASGLGDLRVTTQALEQVLDTQMGSAQSQLGFIEVLAGSYFKLGNPALAAVWADRYFALGGKQLNLRLLQAQAHYMSGGYASAASSLQSLIAEQKAGGARASKAQLELLASSYLKLKDEIGYMATLELLLASYPSAPYWIDLLSRVESQPGFPIELLIDVRRLALSVGALDAANEYLELAELALKAGYPAEARQVLESGAKTGLLETGPQANSYKQLLSRVLRSAQEDATQMARLNVESIKDGETLFSAGYNFCLLDQQAKGLQLMAQSLTLGLKNTNLARLRQGMILARIGDQEAARGVFSSISTKDSTGDLARLWLLSLQASKGNSVR